MLAAKRAFRAFDDRQLPLAEDLFSKTIAEWRRLDRDVAELTSLLVARAGVRTDSNNFAAAKSDLDEAIQLMAPTGEPAGGPLGGRARYREYPDAFVQRGLAKEGLRDWRGALADYDRAVDLWGGGAGINDGVNPFALSYRGRAPDRRCRGRARRLLRGRLDLLARGQERQPGGGGARERGGHTVRIGPPRRGGADRSTSVDAYAGYTDLHVMLAADAWGRGDRAKRSTVGLCVQRDLDGLPEVPRRRARRLARGGAEVAAAARRAAARLFGAAVAGGGVSCEQF